MKNKHTEDLKRLLDLDLLQIDLQTIREAMDEIERLEINMVNQYEQGVMAGRVIASAKPVQQPAQDRLFLMTCAALTGIVRYGDKSPVEMGGLSVECATATLSALDKEQASKLPSLQSIAAFEAESKKANLTVKEQSK